MEKKSIAKRKEWIRKKKNRKIWSVKVGGEKNEKERKMENR